MDVIKEYETASASFLEIVGKQDNILCNGVGKNLMPKLLDLDFVKKNKISRTRCLYELTENGHAYLLTVKSYYND